MDKVLVTGGLGFIGSHTVDLLIKRGHEVTVLDNLEWQVHHGKVPEHANPEATYIRGDVRYAKHWIKALKGTDSIIHLAGAVGVGQSFWQARKYMDINAGGTATLFEILTKESALRKKIERIVVASSKSCYGEGAYRCEEHGVFYPEQRPLSQLKKKEWEMKCPQCGNDAKPTGIREDKPMQNLSPYSLSKYSTERLSLDFAYSLGIHTVALRYFNVYGPRQSLSNPYTGVMAIFLSRLKSGNRPFLFEDGRQLRDYIYVGDVARINADALKKGNGVYNVGTGKPSSLVEVVGYLNRSLGTDTEPVISNDFRPGDNRHDYADNTLLRKSFGNMEFRDMKSGIEELVKWSSKADVHDMFEKEEKERKRYLSI
ncbi:MAG: NAD-dependent epimerase/dehydratase family protein [Thermoplasmata archaeon]|uniref:NAD-dependent epimerase/dehydratase family protein n=1 Tax=Candidatus Sysuiplasma superficiale TaxID=2823368 RepID=A0A8J7YY24_9ARCH|nr:NAD-dependent epimerase/dehydratase family protein [Candidatus Sysuiplasma superficiale]MBX8644974.1 NAD-dependent epimerase/dehydratase family protein [Candidatus Sysuiplasma superficiale]